MRKFPTRPTSAPAPNRRTNLGAATTSSSGGGGGENNTGPASLNADSIAKVPNTRERLRQYQQLVQQLNNTIAETKRPPPRGANAEEIAQRRTKLERILRDVQESIVLTKTEQRNHQNQRYCKAAHDQIDKEESIQDRCDAQDARSNQHSKEYWGATMAYRHAKNDRLDRNIQKAEDFLNERDSQRRQRNAEITRQRNEKLERMRQAEEDRRAASARRHREIRQHCDDLLQRKNDRDRQAQERRERNCNEHEAANAKKRKMLAEERARQGRQRAEEHRQACTRGYLNQVKVTLRPKQKPVMTIVEKDYEQLLADMHEADMRQKKRYAQEEAIRAAERQRRAMHHQARQARQDQRHVELMDKHLTEGQGLVERHRQESEYVRKFRSLRDDYYQKTGEERSQDIHSHQNKAMQRRDDKIDDSFQHNFKRWNRRADKVMETILESYNATLSPSNAPPGEEGGGNASGAGGGVEGQGQQTAGSGGGGGGGTRQSVGGSSTMVASSSPSPVRRPRTAGVHKSGLSLIPAPPPSGTRQ